MASPPPAGADRGPSSKGSARETSSVKACGYHLRGPDGNHPLRVQQWCMGEGVQGVGALGWGRTWSSPGDSGGQDPGGSGRAQGKHTALQISFAWEKGRGIQDLRKLMRHRTGRGSITLANKAQATLEASSQESRQISSNGGVKMPVNSLP